MQKFILMCHCVSSEVFQKVFLCVCFLGKLPSLFMVNHVTIGTKTGVDYSGILVKNK